MEIRRYFPGIVSIALVLFSLAALSEAKIPDFASKQKKAVVTIHINDKYGNEIASGSGFIVDRDGIIATNCKIISQWLEDVQYSLIMKTEGENSYPINKLIAYNRRQDIALFEIKAKGLTLVELPSDYKATEYIKRQVAMYKKSVPQKPLPESAKLPEKTVETRKLTKKIEKKIDNAEDHFLRGVRYESTKKYSDAIETYKKALRIKPDYLDVYVSLGLVYYNLGRYSDAIDAYGHALKIKPDSLSLYNKLGTIYMLTGKHSMAIDTFEQALSIDSRNPETHFNLGIAYFLNGDKDAALEEYIILNKLDKERAENLFDLLYR